MTLGAESAAASAVPPAAAVAALLVETCAMLAVQAARRGDFEAATYLVEQALLAIAGRGPVGGGRLR